MFKFLQIGKNQNNNKFTTIRKYGQSKLKYVF